MNWAETSFVATPFLCALAAGAGAADTDMRWASWLFAVGGFLIGIVFGIAASRIGMLMLFAGGRQARPLVAFATLIGYMLVPMIVMFAGFIVSAGMAVWIARHFV